MEADRAFQSFSLTNPGWMTRSKTYRNLNCDRSLIWSCGFTGRDFPPLHFPYRWMRSSPRYMDRCARNFSLSESVSQTEEMSREKSLDLRFLKPLCGIAGMMSEAGRGRDTGLR